jgi:hypothetical protein
MLLRIYKKVYEECRPCELLDNIGLKKEEKLHGKEGGTKRVTARFLSAKRTWGGTRVQPIFSKAPGGGAQQEAFTFRTTERDGHNTHSPPSSSRPREAINRDIRDRICGNGMECSTQQ